MGLFGKLFDKKTCDICGGDIGILGNKKLEDGNLCKKCAGKLSPFFDDRRHSTINQIREQLSYREQNERELASFHPTRILGKYTKVYLDENTGKFVVSSNYDYKTNNPDIIDVTQITHCDYRIEDYRTEEKREIKGKDGQKKEVSYNPPHYSYHYSFKFTIGVDSPWFDEVRFDVSCSSIEVKSVGEMGSAPTSSYSSASYSTGSGLANAALRGLASIFSDTDPRMQNTDYVEHLNACNEIKETLLYTRQNFMGRNSREDIRTTQSVQTQEYEQRQTAPREETYVRTKCPYCGASLSVASAKFCEYCGAKLN